MGCCNVIFGNVEHPKNKDGRAGFKTIAERFLSQDVVVTPYFPAFASKTLNAMKR